MSEKFDVFNTRNFRVLQLNVEFHRSPVVKLQLFAPIGNAKEQESRSSSVPKISFLFSPTRGYFYVLAS